MKFYIWMIALFAAGILYSAEMQELNSVLAAVNGEPVTLAEILPTLEAREFQLRSAYSGKQLEQEILKLRRSALDEVIDRKLIMADFKEQKLELPEVEIDRSFNQWSVYWGCQTPQELEAKLKKYGSSIEKVRQELKERMAVQAMRYREYLLNNPPSPADVRKEFDRIRKDLDIKPGLELALLKLPAEEKTTSEELAALLKKNPKAWQDAIKRYDPKAAKINAEGMVWTIQLTQLRPEFAAVLKNPVAGKIYPQIAVPDGIFFLKVLKVIPEQQAKFEDHAEKIREQLEQKQKEKSAAEYSKRLRDKAVIEYFIEQPSPEDAPKSAKPKDEKKSK